MHSDDRWQLVGGHVALDLVNTVAWRGRDAAAGQRRDDLTDPAQLRSWLGATGLLPVRRGRVARGQHWDRALVAVRTLRDATGTVLDAHVDRRPVELEALTAIDDAWRTAVERTPLSPVLPLRRRPDPGSPQGAADTLALEVVDLLQHDDLTTLRRCDGRACGWLFLDTSRNRSRRWCDPADCGNRSRVRAYAQRRRAAGGGPA